MSVPIAVQGWRPMSEHSRQTLQRAARHLLQHPLTCAELQPEIFGIIRRHEQILDRWFTQRLGYRLQLNSSTARLMKTTALPHRPALPAPVGTGRAMTQRECTLLSLILAAVAAGPRVISLRDLVDDVRTAAADADITITNEPVERRAMVVALKWMIQLGLASELHEHIDRYEQDDSADAILEVNPDRVGLLPLPSLSRANTVEDLLDRRQRQASSRQWMRARLVEDTALYRTDLNEHEWSELRRRIGDEINLLDEMFALRVEARAEGVAAIDPWSQLSDRTFPRTGTLGHGALLLIEWLMTQKDYQASVEKATRTLRKLSIKHQRHWSKGKIDNIPVFLQEIVTLLLDLRLLAVNDTQLILLPAASRYDVTVRAEGNTASVASKRKSKNDHQHTSNNLQGTLW